MNQKIDEIMDQASEDCIFVPNMDGTKQIAVLTLKQLRELLKAHLPTLPDKEEIKRALQEERFDAECLQKCPQCGSLLEKMNVNHTIIGYHCGSYFKYLLPNTYTEFVWHFYTTNPCKNKFLGYLGLAFKL